MDTLGIDIGTTTVKYVRYRKRSDRIVSYGEYRYRGGWEELRDILSAVKDKEGTNLALAVGITSVELLKKTCSVPIQPEEQMKAGVDDLVAKGMLVPLSDMRREYVVLGEIEEHGTVKQEVLFVGAHRSFVDHVISLLHKAGFRRVLVLTDVGFCYQSTAHFSFDGAVAVIDIGGRQTGIYIIDSGKLLLMREVMTACETLKDAVVGGTALSPNEADEYLWLNGFAETSDNMLTLPLERLAAQIQRTFLVYAQKYPNRPVVKALVAGRGARIPGLPEKLNELLAEDFDVLPSVADIKQEYIPAYTLATRSDRFPNLLTEEITGMAKQAAMTRYAKVAGIVIASAIVLLSLAEGTRLYRAKTTLDGRLAALSQKRQQLAGYTPAQEPVPGMAKPSLKQIGQKDRSFVLLLKYLSTRLPSQVYLKSVRFDAAGSTAKTVNSTKSGIEPGSRKALLTGEMHIHGYVLGEDGDLDTVLMQVMVSLEKSGFLSNVRVEQKEMKSVKGKMLMEFEVSGECRGYEI